MWWNTETVSMKWRPRLEIYTGGKNNYFDPELFVAYSYNWWRYVEKIRGKVVFNAYSYSCQTSGHQSAMRSLLRELKIKIDVTVCVAGGLQELKTKSLQPEYRKLYLAEYTLKRKGLTAKTYNNARDTLKQAKDTIRTLRQLGAVCPKADREDIKLKVIRDEEARLNDARVERALKRETERAARAMMQNLEAEPFQFVASF